MTTRTPSSEDPRVVEEVARFMLDRAAYALACGVVDAQVWTPEGMVVPDRDRLAAEFRAARDAWIKAHDAARGSRGA